MKRTSKVLKMSIYRRGFLSHQRILVPKTRKGALDTEEVKGAEAVWKGASSAKDAKDSWFTKDIIVSKDKKSCFRHQRDGRSR